MPPLGHSKLLFCKHPVIVQGWKHSLIEGIPKTVDWPQIARSQKNAAHWSSSIWESPLAKGKLPFRSQWDVTAYTLIQARWAKSVYKCLQDQYQITTFLFKSSLYNLQEDSDQLYISWLIILIKLTGSTLVIQTENKIFRLYILLLHTPVKSLTYLMMFYLSQPKGKNTLSFPPSKLYQLPPVSYKKYTKRGEMLMLFNVILSVSQFQFIKHFYIHVQFPTPSLCTTASSCKLLPWASCLLAASCCIEAIVWDRFLLVVQVPVNFQWLTDSPLSPQLLAIPSVYVCKGLTALLRTEQKSLYSGQLLPLAENGCPHNFVRLKIKLRNKMTVLCHFIWVKHHYIPVFA